MSKKLFITGGHITPALAVIDVIKKTHKDWTIVFVGRNALEERLVREKNIRFLFIKKGPVGYMQALEYCTREKPDCVVSFGSYVALPVCMMAWILHIPVITHEQTRIPGRANTWIAKIAKKICVTYEDTAHLFPEEKTITTGLPVRSELFSPPEQSPFSFQKERPMLYITGGSTGAESVNTMLFSIIPELLTRYTIIHQTGIPSLAKAKAIYNPYYVARDFFHVRELSWIYHHAKLIVTRSGANTVIELAMLGKQAILIPLPWSAGGEQLENARWFVESGLGCIVDQRTISADQLREIIQSKMEKALVSKKTLNIVENGAGRVASVIDAILS